MERHLRTAGLAESVQHRIDIAETLLGGLVGDRPDARPLRTASGRSGKDPELMRRARAAPRADDSMGDARRVRDIGHSTHRSHTRDMTLEGWTRIERTEAAPAARGCRGFVPYGL